MNRAVTDAGRFVAPALLVVALAGCASTPPPTVALPMVDPNVAMAYGPVEDAGFQVAAIDTKKIDPQFLRQVVTLPPNIPNEPGTIVVDPAAHFLYLVFENGQALRYGIGVGRDGFSWNGDATVNSKQEWPKWFPPKEMVERDPRAAPWAEGMPGGLENPLGARALYLYQGKVDTLYRIHGTTEPWSIGKSVSSGCIRMFNQDVMDLYGRVPDGTKVIVLPSGLAPQIPADAPTVSIPSAQPSPA